MRAFDKTPILTASLVSSCRQAVQRYFAGERDGFGLIPPHIWEQIVRLTTGPPPEASPALGFPTRYAKIEYLSRCYIVLFPLGYLEGK